MKAQNSYDHALSSYKQSTNKLRVATIIPVLRLTYLRATKGLEMSLTDMHSSLTYTFW